MGNAAKISEMRKIKLLFLKRGKQPYYHLCENRLAANQDKSPKTNKAFFVFSKAVLESTTTTFSAFITR
jgi:hypothetical protein